MIVRDIAGFQRLGGRRKGVVEDGSWRLGVSLSCSVCCDVVYRFRECAG